MALPEFLGRQLGPLPVGAWLGVVGTGAGIGYVLRRRGGFGGSPPAAPVEALPNDTAPGAGNLTLSPSALHCSRRLLRPNRDGRHRDG